MHLDEQERESDRPVRGINQHWDDTVNIVFRPASLRLLVPSSPRPLVRAGQREKPGRTHQKMSVPARSVVVISELAGMVLGMFFHPFPNMQRMITEVNLPPTRG